MIGTIKIISTYFMCTIDPQKTDLGAPLQAHFWTVLIDQIRRISWLNFQPNAGKRHSRPNFLHLF